MISLMSIEQLRPLSDIGRRHGVRFTLRGGVAFRLAAAPQNNVPLDLFDLTPFTADVDLMHSGSPEQTRQLLEEIRIAVAGAECFRWDLRAQQDVQEILNCPINVVPARMIEITDDVVSNIIDPAGGAKDIREGDYRYCRNPLFKQSRRYISGRDLEIFSALIYLQTLAEAKSPKALEAHKGWAAMCAVFEEGIADREVLRLLQEHAYLRSRLRRLLVAVATAFPTPLDYHAAAERSGLTGFIKWVTTAGRLFDPTDNRYAFFIGSDTEAIQLLESDRIMGDTYRLRFGETEWTTGGPPGVILPTLGGQQQVLLVSPVILVEPGEAVVAGSFQERLTDANEMVHVEVPHSVLAVNGIWEKSFQEAEISAFLMLSVDNAPWEPYSLPCIAQYRGRTQPRLALRMNGLGLLATAARLGSQSTLAHLVVVGWKL